MGKSPQPLAAHFFRHQYARLVAVLVRQFGSGRLELLEDSAQTALERAVGNWARRGLPEHPEAWLLTVAKRCAIDELRRSRAAQGLPVEEAPEVVDESASRVRVAFANEIADDRLRMLFACADERLPWRTRVVLSLRLLCGFSTREIASCLFMTEPNVQKTMERGRARFREVLTEGEVAGEREARGEGFPTGLDSQEALANRLPAVQKVIYLQFNEGYSYLSDDLPMRRELCAEAIRLATLLVSHSVSAAPSSWALLALLHFHSARLASRTDADGLPLLLEEQDRGRWDRTHIDQGFRCLSQALLPGGETASRLGAPSLGAPPLAQLSPAHFTKYHAEAFIAAEHCMAPSLEETRWSEIVELYELLERIEPSPLYTLNRAIALAEWRGPLAGLELLQRSAPPTWLGRYAPWHATLGELRRRAGDFDTAEIHLRRALEVCSASERGPYEYRLQLCQRRVRGSRKAAAAK